MRACSGKTALVTSAARGNGRAIALALGKGGAQVLVHHHRSPVAAEQVVRDIRSSGGNAMAVAVDLSGRDGPDELAERARAIIGDRLDILVFNSSLSKAPEFHDASIELFDAGFAVNVRAPLFLVKGLLPVMRRGSSLVMTLEPHVHNAHDPAISALSGALEGLVDKLRPMLRSTGIQLSALLPARHDEATCPALSHALALGKAALRVRPTWHARWRRLSRSPADDEARK